jgi:hypothetical protein
MQTFADVGNGSRAVVQGEFPSDRPQAVNTECRVGERDVITHLHFATRLPQFGDMVVAQVRAVMALHGYNNDSRAQ